MSRMLKELSEEEQDKVINELSTLQTRILVDVVALADKYDVDRDIMFNTCTATLCIASETSTLKNFKADDEPAKGGDTNG